MTRRRFAVAAALLVACGKKPPQGSVNRFPLRGEVVRLDAKTHVATIKHEKIPGFMEAMTMDFPVKDPAEYAKLALGRKITATVVQRPSDYEYWIEDIRVSP